MPQNTIAIPIIIESTTVLSDNTCLLRAYYHFQQPHCGEDHVEDGHYYIHASGGTFPLSSNGSW